MSEGIILRSTAYRDNDLILTILSESLGKLSAYQRAGKRGKTSSCEVFDCGRFEFKETSRGMARVSHFIPRSSFNGLRNSLDSISSATFVCEVFDFIIPENDEADAEKVYTLLHSSLNDISRTVDTRALLRLSFAVTKNLIAHAGLIDPADELEPSSHNLRRLIGIIENFSERKLRSAHTVYDMIASLSS